MSSAHAVRRISLAKRIRGPNARPVDLLVERATQTALQVSAEYAGFASTRVAEIGAMMESLSPLSRAADWQALMVAVQDLRSSSITCGSDGISRIAQSWEGALDWQYRHESRLMAVMQLHLDALKLAVSGQAQDQELKALASRLTLMVQGLNPTA